MARNPYDARWRVIADGLEMVLLDLAGYARDDSLFAERLISAFDVMVDGGKHPHFPDGIAFQEEADTVRKALEYFAELREKVVREMRHGAG